MGPEVASEDQLELLRRWAGCPDEFANTDRDTAAAMYRTLFRLGVRNIEAWQILNYLRGELPLSSKHFDQIQDVFMCESSSDREAVRSKYQQA
ncbi:hypothetical protein AB7M23_002979 [Pseudomonas sp. HLS-6 TE3448]